VSRFKGHTMDIDRALGSCDQYWPVILVAHQPNAAKLALDSKHRVDLVLSGGSLCLWLKFKTKTWLFLSIRLSTNSGIQALDMFEITFTFSIMNTLIVFQMWRILRCWIFQYHHGRTSPWHTVSSTCRTHPWRSVFPVHHSRLPHESLLRGPVSSWRSRTCLRLWGNQLRRHSFTLRNIHGNYQNYSHWKTLVVDSMIHRYW